VFTLWVLTNFPPEKIVRSYERSLLSSDVVGQCSKSTLRICERFQAFIVKKSGFAVQELNGPIELNLRKQQKSKKYLMFGYWWCIAMFRLYKVIYFWQMREIRSIMKTTGIWWSNPEGLLQNKTARFSTDRRRHLMSLITMIGPSPDWCVGRSVHAANDFVSWKYVVILKLGSYFTIWLLLHGPYPGGGGAQNGKMSEASIKRSSLRERWIACDRIKSQWSVWRQRSTSTENARRHLKLTDRKCATANCAEQCFNNNNNNNNNKTTVYEVR